MANVDLTPTGTASDSASFRERSPRTWPMGVVPFKHTVTLATTHIDNDDDKLLVFQFPDPCFLNTRTMVVACQDALDAHATPTLTFDVGIGDSDYTIDVELINNCAAVTLNAVDYVDDSAVGNAGGWVNVAGKYLIVDITATPATASAGTLAFSGEYSSNVFPTTA